MSSVTVACCVRSPSATACSSFISRRIAAWLASLTRLASCSWRSASQALALRPASRAGPGRATYSRSRPAPPSDQQHAPTAAAGPRRQRAEAGRRAEPVLHRLQAFAQRLAVGDDRGLRLARRDQRPAGCRGSRWPAVRVSSYCLQQRGQALAGLRRRGCRAGAARRCRRAGPGRVSRNEFRSLPSRNTASGLDAFHRQELVGRLADALRQHHQLADGRQLGRRGVLLQLQRRRPSRRSRAGRTTGG